MSRMLSLWSIALWLAACGEPLSTTEPTTADSGVDAGAGPDADPADAFLADGGTEPDAEPDAGPPPVYTRVLGHRGMAWNHAGNPWPENSMISIRAAIDHGADGVEVDLVKTADDVFVLRHDDAMATGSLDDGRPRTSCGGRLTRLTWAEVADCEALSHAEDGFEAPLDRVETLLGEPQTGYLVLDVKNDGMQVEGERSVELLIGLIDAAGARDRVLLMLYHPETIAIARAAGLPACLKRHTRDGATGDEMADLVVDAGATASCANASLVDDDFMGALRDRGLEQVAFLLYDDPGEGFARRFAPLVERGAHGIITDRVADAVRVRDDALRRGGSE